MTFGADLLGYARYASKLRTFLKDAATVERGREVIRERLRNRTENLLGVVRTEVYGNPSSPYLA
ncbi:MAG: hypothetical protein JXA58_08480, partial [Dehalococcoidia bacterium]|nr:hypothetical protein [Dehalococcoidia bacterium]